MNDEDRDRDSEKWTLPVFAFPAEAGPRLPTPEGWKAKLA